MEEDDASQYSIHRLQAFPTSARMILKPSPRSVAQSWQPEKPQNYGASPPGTARTSRIGTATENTVRDRSVLPFLLGGLRANRNLCRGGTAQRAEDLSIPRQGRRSPGEGSADSRFLAKSSSTHLPCLRCSSKCTLCSKVAQEVDQFERDNNLPQDDGDDPSAALEDGSRAIAAPAAAILATRYLRRMTRVRKAAKIARIQAKSNGPAPPKPTEDDIGSLEPEIDSNENQKLSVNPIVGLFSTIPLPAIWHHYQAFIEQYPHIVKTGMQRHEFRQFVTGAVPHITLSEDYLLRMFLPFALPKSHPPAAAFADIFNYLCRYNGSTEIERNVSFFFACLDEGKQGYLPGSVLNRDVVSAWAENRVIGTPLYAWRHVADAWSCFLPGELSHKVTRDDLRMLVYGSHTLSAAFSSSLDCVLTDQNRHPLKPPPHKIRLRRHSNAWQPLAN